MQLPRGAAPSTKPAAELLKRVSGEATSPVNRAPSSRMSPSPTPHRPHAFPIGPLDRNECRKADDAGVSISTKWEIGEGIDHLIHQ
jgi:hypothetical protein